ncbi:MAG: efflux RND transporter periplasmic adaptor subunit [Firmicutes bacterium]|nr:efflux RND transporter periplasmic adaptor subunit [Bacillota bacterium]
MNKKTKRKTVLKWVLAAVLIAAAVLGLRFVSQRRQLAELQAKDVYTMVHPEKQNIIKSLTASGALQPADSYYVIGLVEGEVLSCTFEEGDIVEKDSILYEIDSSNVSGSMERADISLDQAVRSYNDLTDSLIIKADSDGQIISLDAEVGDKVTQGQVLGTIRDSRELTLKVPFVSEDARGFSVGQTAEVVLDSSFETLYGTVSAVSAADIQGAGNTITRTVTVKLTNPGALNEGQTASAFINGIGCASSGTLSFGTSSVIMAKMSGEVIGISAAEGAYVKKDQKILTLGGEDIEKTLKNASDNVRLSQISKDSTQDALDNYTIKSPIYGTIVDKSYKTGDKLSAGKSMCTIYDLSYLEIILNVDELDILQIAVGQPVTIAADAVEGEEYKGIVTKVSVAGTTYNGATTYPVTIRIDEFEKLLPGMNADATVIVAQADGVMAIPNGAVSRGNLVLVTADSPSAKNAVEGTNAPEGYVYVEVTTGISNDDFVEITSGLSEDDTIAYIPNERNVSNDLMSMFGRNQGIDFQTYPGGM